MSTPPSLVPRRIVAALDAAMAASPVVAITGARTAGKSTLVGQVTGYRTADGVEVNLVLEAADGRVAAIEIKAGSRLTSEATRGLMHLRDRLRDRFTAGLVLNTGSHTQRIGDRLSVAPVDQLWHGAGTVMSSP